MSRKPAGTTVFQAVSLFGLRRELASIVVEDDEMQANGFEQDGDIAHTSERRAVLDLGRNLMREAGAAC